MIRLVIWVVGIFVAILFALFGIFGAVAASHRSSQTQSQAGSQPSISR